MNKPDGVNEAAGTGKSGKFNNSVIIGLIMVGLIIIFILSGCSLKDVIDPVSDYLAKDASEQEETAPYFTEETLLYAQINDSQGKALAKPDGEPLTVMVAYETASGGEPYINSDGELETHPHGEVVTYAPGTPVTDADGNEETYEGGETVTDILGIPEADELGEIATRAAGEVVTHGEDEIVYDEAGERVTYNGEPYTYRSGDFMYDTDGERMTHAVTVRKNTKGEYVYKDNGEVDLRAIELVTDESGDPVIEDSGEAATIQLDPAEPELLYEPVLEEGNYYINNIESSYVYFSAPLVEASDIPIVVDEDVDPDQYAGENGEGQVNNLQLEMMGEDLPYFELHYDAEGYAYFVLQDTDMLLTVSGSIRNGVNVMPRKRVKVNYPQYKYWDDPPYTTVAENQKWIIKKSGDKYSICSAVNENYVMTVDDQYGIQYANIMVWEQNGSDQQIFDLKKDSPHIDKYIDEGTYYIRSALTNSMVVTLRDDDYYSGSLIYLDSSYYGEGQRYNITYDEYGFATITHGDSDMALTVSYGTAVNDQTICQAEYDGGLWQKWIIDKSEYEGYYIRSALNTEEVLDLTSGYSYCGNSIQLYWKNRTYSQFWYFDIDPVGPYYSYDTMDSFAQNFSSETEYLILISQETNHVGVYKGSQGNWTNIYYWNCVTGKASTPTIRGEFTVFVKTPSFDGNTDSPVWYTVYYATSFYPQYFFHSIIYYQGTMNVMDATMSYSASHGCVRLDTDNALWIYENIPLDTKVVSY